MDFREAKALEIAARCKLTATDGGWLVPSQSGSGTYRVVTTTGAESCQCEDWLLRREACKHIIAARLVEERDGKRPAPPINTDVIPKRPTYKQNWPAYNQAQSIEKDRIQALLAELCRGVPEPPPPRVGRHPVPVADRLFVITYKAYCGLSTRRFACDLRDAFERGHISRSLHFSKCSHYLCEPELTGLLRELVERSAMPLRAIETEFAVDSTGFSASKFVRWVDEKHHCKRSGRDWVKAHICTGVKTNVITAVEIKDRDANDCPLLPDLITTTARTFKIGEVSADKAYLSHANIETIAALGGMPYIAPKSNTTGATGGLLERMYHYYCFNREEFLRHYHKRSNVESTFSAVKRRFGDSVRCKNPVAMTNEVLCKFVLHNLTCVILSQIELGIDAAFWGQPGGPQDVLPLVRRQI